MHDGCDGKAPLVIMMCMRYAVGCVICMHHDRDFYLLVRTLGASVIDSAWIRCRLKRMQGVQAQHGAAPCSCSTSHEAYQFVGENLLS